MPYCCELPGRFGHCTGDPWNFGRALNRGGGQHHKAECPNVPFFLPQGKRLVVTPFGGIMCLSRSNASAVDDSVTSKWEANVSVPYWSQPCAQCGGYIADPLLECAVPKGQS